MKKQFIVAALSVVCIGLMGCSGENSNNIKESQKSESNQDDSQTEKREIELDDNLQKIEVDKPYMIETDSGNYSFTITELKRTDWLNEEGKKVILLCYEVENKNYEPDDGSMLLINSKALRLSDADGNELESWNSTLSKLGFPDFVESGEKKVQEQPYVASESTEQVRLVYIRGEQEIADMALVIEE